MSVNCKQCTFETVLVARSEGSLPSELELVLSASHMNQWCHKVRIVASLFAGAHFVFTSSSKPTIAIRVYDTRDIVSFEKKEKIAFDTTDLDQLQQFRDSYENSLVFFILPPGELQQRQLTEPCSFFQTAQRVLSKPSVSGRQNKTEQNSEENQDGSAERTAEPATTAMNQARLFIVTDVVSVLNNVSSFINSIAPDKCLMKKQFFEGQARKASQQQGAAVANAFRTWSSHHDIPIADVNVLISFLGNFESIMLAASAAAHENINNCNDANTNNVLHTIPIQESSKIALLNLFYGEQEQHQKKQHAESNEKNIDTTVDQHASLYDHNNIMNTYDEVVGVATTYPPCYPNNDYTNRLRTITGEITLKARKAQLNLQKQHQHQHNFNMNSINFTPIMATNNHSSNNLGHGRGDFGMQQVSLYGNSHQLHPSQLLLHDISNNTNNIPTWQQQHQRQQQMNPLHNHSKLQQGKTFHGGNAINFNSNRKNMYSRGSFQNVANNSRVTDENNYYPNNAYHIQQNIPFNLPQQRRGSNPYYFQSG